MRLVMRVGGGAQVLYLTEPIDEPALNTLGNYEDHVFVDVTREGLDLTGDSEEDKKKVTLASFFL